MRTLIRGGTVYDGTGAPGLRADLLVQDGRIDSIAPTLHADDAQIIDASGKAVTPGFIDMHRHCDTTPMSDPDFGRIELAQGISATVVGNCGLAPVPCAAATKTELYDFLEPVTGPVPPECCFADYEQYVTALQAARPKIHMGFFAAAGAIKTSIKGFSNTPYTTEELRRAADRVREAVDHGALGVSLGIMYAPECYSTQDDLAFVAAPAARNDGLLTCHIRGEGDGLVSSVREALSIGERAGMRVNISHFKATGMRNWRHVIFEALEVIEAARARGQAATVDVYPYDAGATTLFSLLPPAILGADNAETLRTLSTPAGKAVLRKAIAQEHDGWDNMALSIGWDRILISSTSLPEHRNYPGQDIAALAQKQGYGEPSDFVCDLLCAEQGKVGIIVRSMSIEDVETVARLPYAAIISDALYGGGTHPHPRLYGAFPRAIRELVFARGVLTLEQALHKMCSMPAERLRLKDRGILRPGAVADINIFDPRALRDQATFERPMQLATGMDWVLLAGQTAWRHQEVLPGVFGALLTPTDV